MKTLDSVQTGKLIRAYRKAQNLTQFQLAELAEIDDKQLGKIERGVHYPSVPTFLKIVKALDININEFYSDSPITHASNLMNIIRSANPKELDLVCGILEVVKNCGF